MIVQPSNQCILCQQALHFDLSWRNLFSMEPIQSPCLCTQCRGQFQPWMNQATKNCQACQRPLTGEDPFHYAYFFAEDGQVYCHDCYHWRQTYSLAFFDNLFLFDYNDFFKEWIIRYKYHGDSQLAQVMRAPLRAAFQRLKHYTWCVLPSAPISLAERLFHSTGFLLDQAGLDYIQPFIYLGDGRRQAYKSRQERLQLDKIFGVNPHLAPSLSDKQGLLIFDDIYTTGATLLQAKQALVNFWTENGQPVLPLKGMCLARNNSTRSEYSAFKESEAMI